MNKIALGTAQFGLDYGINNKRGKIPRREVFKILDFSLTQGIDLLDTAFAYGESEKIIGSYAKQKKDSFKIVSKLPPCHVKEIESVLDRSLKRMNSKSIYGYLIHDFGNFKKNPETLQALKKIKAEGKIDKIGFSLYYPSELESLLWENIYFDLIQLPYSILDQRFVRYMARLKSMGVEIHVRSVFLQGLMFKRPGSLKGKFLKIKEKITRIRSLCDESGVPLSALCINFAVLNGFIDKVIVGIDSLDNIKEIALSSKYLDDVKKIFDKLIDFNEEDE